MNFNVGKYLAIIFLWFYVGSVVCTLFWHLVIPLGNEEILSCYCCVFAILMAYMMFAAIFLAVHTVNSIVHNHKTDFTIALVFTNTKFRDLWYLWCPLICYISLEHLCMGNLALCLLRLLNMCCYLQPISMC